MRSGTLIYPAIDAVVFGVEAGEAIRQRVEAGAFERVFIVSSRSLAVMRDGPLQRVRSALGRRVAAEFNQVRAHTPREDVVAVANLARSVDADVLLAIGGGSVIDATKAALVCLWMRLCAAHELSAFGPSWSARASITPPPSPIRMMSVSTTLSAAEFTGIAGVTDSATRTKEKFSHRLLVPQTVILDPRAVRHTPLALLHSTAVRSIDHAVETYCSPLANSTTERASLHGLELLVSALRGMVEPVCELRVLLDAQLGMWQAITPGMSGVSVGASHGIGYALGSGYGVGHGETSCVMLPAVLQWNAAHGEGRQQALSVAMRRPGMAAAAVIRELVEGLGLPSRLRDVGIQRSDLHAIAELALGYPELAQNPVPITRASQVGEILEIAW